jgi:hypothetical protein
MCHLIRCSFEHELTDADLNNARRLGFHLAESRNPSIISMAPDMHFYDITDGMCSCSLYREPVHRENFDATLSYEDFVKARLIERFRRKNWNKNKIDRALKNAYENSPAGKKLFYGIDPVLWDFLTSIPDLYCRMGLLIHFYTGGFESERVEMAGRVKTSLEGACAASIEEDTFYLITRTH